MSKNIYKAKRLDDGLWVEGYYLKKIDPLLGVESSFILNQGDLCSFFSWNKVDPETVCQCTGMTDKEGWLIFENDILLHENWNQYKVVFKDYMFTCEEFDLPFCDCPNNVFSEGTSRLEVIGNIHDEEWKQ